MSGGSGGGSRGWDQGGGGGLASGGDGDLEVRVMRGGIVG